MGIRSDVAIVLTNQLFDEVKKDKLINELFFYAAHLDSDEEQTLIVLENVKFELIEGNVFNNLFHFLEGRDEEYYILEVCSEFTQTKTYGELDFHFDVGYTFQLTY